MPRYKISNAASISLSAATAKTVVGVITTSTRRAKGVGCSISFNSTTATHQSVLVELIVTNGTLDGTFTATTPVPIDQAETAAICGGGVNWTLEPTVVTVLDRKLITPVGGTYIEPFEFLDQPIVGVLATEGRVLGVRLTAPDAQTGVYCTLTFEE